MSLKLRSDMAADWRKNWGNFLANPNTHNTGFSLNYLSFSGGCNWFWSEMSKWYSSVSMWRWPLYGLRVRELGLESAGNHWLSLSMLLFRHGFSTKMQELQICTLGYVERKVYIALWKGNLWPGFAILWWEAACVGFRKDSILWLLYVEPCMWLYVEVMLASLEAGTSPRHSESHVVESCP